MSDFDPDRFEDKYVHYLAELETAYKRAFSYMNERYDSDLVHAIDQEILDESEPIYEGDGSFRIALPADPAERVDGIPVSREEVDRILADYVDRLQVELRAVFGFDAD